MFGRSILLGATAGILSGLACIVFEMVYKETVFVDFSILISKGAYFGACIFGCVLASIGFWAAVKLTPKYGEIIFNFLFALLTFASILGPIMYVWPLEMPDNQMEAVSYFSMYAMTLHFFPIVVWFTLKPLFIKK